MKRNILSFILGLALGIGIWQATEYFNSPTEADITEAASTTPFFDPFKSESPGIRAIHERRCYRYPTDRAVKECLKRLK